ncbi:MAG: hypothetical protein FD156_2452 [Nitrospirae bacterium]|nr:MAG: hypothetical protein FD156_2452 [Nitrospirota bacterium]
MFEKAIVAYIDILGYKDLVERVAKKPELVKRMEDLFYEMSVNAVRKLREIFLESVDDKSDVETQDYLKKIADSIGVRCIADSFIFTLPLSNINFRCKTWDEQTTVGNRIETYFSVMTFFATLFISKMGYLLRGGISIGNHYESEREKQLFVFSEAHNMAVTLENKKAEYPRIVLDEPLRKYLEEISYPNIESFFYKDEDGYYCLDIYSALRNWGDNKEKKLAEIKEGITFNLESNFNNARELGKLLYFVSYHNRKVTSTEVNLTHQAFDISKYEKQLRYLTRNRITPALEYHKALGNWVLERIGGKNISASPRIALPAGCFDVAIEHHNGIVVLCENGHFGTACALIRVIFEACVRGIWLHNCATEDELIQYRNDNLRKGFNNVLQEVEQLESFKEGVLSSIKEEYWGPMNSFAHTGYFQVSRRLSADSLGPNYADEEAIKVLTFSGSMCLLAALQIALLIGDSNLSNEILGKIKEFGTAKF